MSNRMTIEDFFHKLNWEGGIAGLIEYGIKHTDVPEAIADDWKELCILYGKIDRWIENNSDE